MAMKEIKKPVVAPPPKPQKIRYFRHVVTGTIHEADETWAPVMAGRADLMEVTQPEVEVKNDEN